MDYQATGPEIPERQALPQMTKHILEECRMVLPGIQALFGFQLMAVFNQGFWEHLSQGERVVHLIAMCVVAVAVALVMAPAAYHRQCHLDTITRRFIIISSRLLLLSMIPLIIGTCLDVYLIARMVLNDPGISLGVAGVLALVFVTCWFVLPRILPTAVLRREGEHRPARVAGGTRPATWNS